MNQLNLTTSVSLVTVFVQGLLSFFSPCVLPLLPLYLGYLSGGTGSKAGRDGSVRVRTAVNTLFFVIGISAAFFTLGLGLSAAGILLRSWQRFFTIFGGVLVILLGLYHLGLFGSSPFLERERRLPFSIQKAAMSPLTALVMGFVFSFAWTPCIGPVLSGVLVMASAGTSRAQGFALIGLYTLGFVLPFLAVGLFATSLPALFRRHRGIVRYTTKAGGALLILMGVLMLSGHMSSIGNALAQLSGQSTQPEAEAAGELPETEMPGETTAELEFTEDDTEIAAEAATEVETGAETETEPPAYPAPEFSLLDQYGNRHVLSDYRGKVVFLNFWATWCPPCRAEMPDIQKLYEEFSEEGREDVVILGVAFPRMGNEKDVEGIAAFLEENGYTYPVLMDEEYGTMWNYYITAYPTTFMIDREGNIFGYVTGSLPEETMRSIIEQTLGDAD